MIDPQETRRAIAAVSVVGQIDGYDVIRRASVLELLQRREPNLQALVDALFKACGDDRRAARETFESQGGQL
jgi:hypothetical protein